ncbi:ty3-gypsy retrotransposon protein [Tanacetum coccineum]
MAKLEEIHLLLKDQAAVHKQQSEAFQAQIAALQAGEKGDDPGCTSQSRSAATCGGFNLEGDAAEWFRWMSRNKLIKTWEGFLESWVRGHKFPGKFLLLMADEDDVLEHVLGAEHDDAMETGDISILNSLVAIDIQGLSMNVDLYVLPMKGPNIVLRIQWLQKLGKVTYDYSKQTMEFTWSDKGYMLRDGVYRIYELYNFTAKERDQGSMAAAGITVLPEIVQLLTRFEALFQDELEKLVNEMLSQRIIQASQIPFSSPVLLVKKKDGSYHFCVDYRALNEVTIKDRFLTPTEDEMFDELGGADHHFYVKESKCVFGAVTLEYLGHIISGKGVEMDSKKVVAVSDWPVPTNQIAVITEYLVNISKRRAFWSLIEDILKINDSDYQYAVSIKEDTAMDDPNITMKQYIRLEEEKAQKRGKVFNWETAKYGKIWYDEDIHDLRSPTVSSLNDEIDFRVSFDDSDDEDYTNEFPAIVYNDALTSKLDFLTKPTVSPQHIDEFNLKDETSLSECDEEEQNVLNFNDLFPFNVIYPNDSKSDKDNDDDKVDIEHSSGDLSVKPLPDVINTDVGAYAHGSNKLLETIITKYLVNISKRRTFWSLNEDILKINDSDYQYVVSIKEDTAYPCLHSPKTTKETSSIRRIQRRPIRRIQDIVCEYSRRYQMWSILQETLMRHASDVGIGAVLMQRGQPLSYFSRKLGPHMRAAATYQKELFAMVEAVYKWRQYLLGRRFTIRTDHRSLKELMQQVIQTPLQQKYVRKLMGFDFVIEYKPRVNNQVVDALSRIYEEEEDVMAAFMTMSQPLSGLISDLRQENETIDELQQLHQKLDRNEPMEWFRREQGMIVFCDRYYIGTESKLKELLLSEFHNTPKAGHNGVKKRLVELSALFYWKGMRKSVEEFIGKCLVCQQTKYSTQAPGGLLQPLPTPSRVWEDISMDFITGLPVYKGLSVIFVVVDRFTKYVHFGPLPASFNASKVADVFIDMVVKLHGIPKTIGYGVRPTSRLGALLQWAEYSYNTSFHSSIRMTPYQAVYGRVPPAIVPYPIGSSKVTAVEELLVERDALLRQLKQNLLVAKHRMEMQANRNRRDVEFKSGDRVLVKLQPYRQITLAKRHSNKLAKKSGQGTGQEEVTNFTKEEHEGQPVEQPLAICATRVVLQKGVPTRQVLVQWSGSSPEEATWEWLSEFKAAYPSYHLEDKVIVEGLGNVTAEFDEPHDEEPTKPKDKEPTDDTNKSRLKRATSRPVWFKDYATG